MVLSLFLPVEIKYVAFNQKPVTCSSHFSNELYEEKESVTLLFECLWAVMFDKPEMISFGLVDYFAIEASWFKPL